VAINVYNSLTKKIENFRSITPQQVLMYTCGPTVYFFQHIGNFRTFTTSDFVLRTMQLNGYKVRYVMNLTDVGHLTGDNLGDADVGEDRLEIAAEKEGKSAREIADYYTKHFMTDYDRLNLTKPQKFPRATEYIQEQTDLIKTLEMKGYTYKTSDGMYFDTSKFDNYSAMSGLTPENIQEGARVEANPEKRNSNDFALWKFSSSNEQRWQEWNSPWGVGFPGWHIECSAMAMKELGETIDIHMGGEDHKMIHHPNEIAQSECATGKKFVNYWLHVTHLQVDGGKMSKSLGNIYTVSDVQNKGFDPLALRYFYMTAHYRNTLNFTWGALQSADAALKKLYSLVGDYKDSESAEVDYLYSDKFKTALNDDFNLPKALAVVWDLLKSDLPEGVKLVTVLKFDEVLGLKIDEHVGLEIPEKIINLARTRQQYRKNNIWDKADVIRREIENQGYVIEDTNGEFKLRKKI
jgi:cysteinyl-tRNA synthetase